ncbi:MAG: FAD binding domain-containing protein [Candidatus Limnocylindrales bacterium]
MIPRFRLDRPATIEAALEARNRDRDESAYMAGGTELLQVMKMGLTQVSHLIDLKGIPGLRDIGIGADGVLEIGALATHRDIERSALVARALPEFVALERGVGNVRVRATGTIGGNLAFAEPHSDPAPFLIACGATVELTGAGGIRTVPLDGFIAGPLATIREDDEILRAIRIPATAAGEGRAYEKLAFAERPTVSVAVAATVRDGRVAHASIVLGSVTDTPISLAATAKALVGRDLHELDDVIASLLHDPPDAIDAFTDQNGSADYKRHLAWQLVGRATRRATGLLAA